MSVARRRIIPQSLFIAGEVGTYSDIETYATNYFTDAGTTPSTIGDAIYQINDQSGNGVNWTQATATARPVLSARYNLLEFTEQFDNAYWVKTRATITADAVTAPDGTTTADKLVANTDTNSHFISMPGFASGMYRLGVFAKAGEYGFLKLTLNDGGFPAAWFNLVSGTVGTVGIGAAASISNEGDGWYFCEIENDAPITDAYIEVSTSDGSSVFAGDGTSGIYIWGADLRLASDTDQPAYQRVGDLGADPGDYDTAGFKKYLKFDRGDDAVSGTLAADTYSVAVGTRSGIYFGTSAHAGGTFAVGPTTYTGGPAGLFDDLTSGSDCRLIGPPIIVNRAFTAAEKAAIIQWFQNRGAGPEYTP